MEGQWVVHFLCRRCRAETTVIQHHNLTQQYNLTRSPEIPELNCGKCQTPNVYLELRSKGSVCEDFTFTCPSCNRCSVIPRTLITLTADETTGEVFVKLPKKVQCEFCPAKTDVPL